MTQPSPMPLMNNKSRSSQLEIAIDEVQNRINKKYIYQAHLKSKEHLHIMASAESPPLWTYMQLHDSSTTVQVGGAKFNTRQK